jgi:hypothetical protein
MVIKKPSRWFRYVDDTIIVQLHGKQELQGFLRHLNGIHQNITFTMKIKENGALPILDIIIMSRFDGSFGHAVNAKPTHTNLYLHAKSEYHLAQK